MKMRILQIMTAMSIGLAASSIFSYSHSTVSNLKLETNGRYKVEGVLTTTPQGHQLTANDQFIKLNGNCDCSGYGIALVNKQGGSYNLVNFSQKKHYLKVVEFKKTTSSTIAILENGSSINFDDLSQEDIHRGLSGTYVIR